MGANIIIPKNGGGQSIWEGLLGDKTFDILSKDIYGVLELRDYVFANKNITHAELSPMIQTIGENAFKNCSQLIDATIPNSVTRIKADAFSGCSQLSTIYFRGVQEEWDDIVKDNGWDGGRLINVICMDPTSLDESNGIIQGLSGPVQDGIVVIPPMINGDTITSVGREAFGLYADIKEIIFPRTITELPYELFTVYQSRSRLQTAVLPEGVTRLRSTFCGCKYLKNVTIPSTLVSLEYQTFDYCTALEAIYISDLAAWCNITFESSAGSNPLKFAHHLYLNGAELTNVDIPNTVTQISSGSFNECYSVETLNLPSSLTNLEYIGVAFDGCKNLREIRVKDTSGGYYADGNCLIGNQHILLGCKTSIIPQDNNIEVIGDHAFSGDRGEFSITIPSNIKRFGYGSFYKCSGLQSVSFPNTQLEILHDAFNGCIGLTSIDVPSNLTIDSSTFQDCTSLQEISGSISNTTTVGGACHSSGFTIRVTEGGTVGVGQYYGVPVKELYWPKDITYIDRVAFNANTTLTSLHYDGTISEWEAIPKDTDWNGSDYLKTIHCTDGDIAL